MMTPFQLNNLNTRNDGKASECGDGDGTRKVSPLVDVCERPVP